MPRPLIIKVANHKSQPNKKATGSIDVQLIKGSSKGSMYETYHSETDHAPSVAEVQQVNPPEESGSSSVVRSLISRYETSTDKATLNKYKSKSMVDLQKPQTVAKKTQDDFLYNRGKYNDEDPEKNFNFKKVFLKFETSSHSEKPKTSRFVPQVKNYKPPNYNNDSLDLGSIKQKARTLLEKYQRDRTWDDDQMLEFLQQIQKSDGLTKPAEVKPSYAKKSEEKVPAATYKQGNTLQRAKSLDHGELDQSLKVKDIKNIYESKIDETKPLSRSVSSYATYFGLKPTDEESTQFNKLIYTHRGLSATPFNDKGNNNQMEGRRSEGGDSSSSEEEDSYDVEFVNGEMTSDVIEGNRIITQPVLASSMKIQEMRNLFANKYVPYESYVQNENDNPEEETNIFDSDTPDIHVVENRMLPPPTILEMDGYVNVEQAKQRIEELTNDIEEYEQQIANLPEGNELEASYINEVLIRMLIKLDDVKTYGDALIKAERKKAIQFVQSCILKLREKLKGTEENS